ncbi:RagB/SusD family nutrient uptake outer membrane protein [Mucilaginibacter dorajii]|uniref:RagB/SusD family nutrient uptake outer membrane protein n=2 Tax=Mucilaginibacter dorajii TaxID=692994 RepID=A0ABP7QYN5_9SPHI
MALSTGCKKFLEPDYKTNVTAEVVFSSDDNAQAAINGLYSTLFVNSSSNGEITRSIGMAADELTYYTSNVTYDQFQKNQVLPNNANITSFWTTYYNVIYQCNAIIENATASTGMSQAYKIQIIGEAKFFRAFCHFYLVNLFGPVPLMTTTAKEKTIFAPRSSVQDVYTQIKTDLTEAMNTLPADYSVSDGRRIRANKWAAAALLARVFLYTKDWANAEAIANTVLANTSLYALQTSANINSAFVNNNSESILELDRSASDNYTNEGYSFLGYLNFSTLLRFPLPADLLNSFETGDLRKINWIITVAGVSTPYKYKLYSIPTNAATFENYLLLRLAEQYLIRAEARAQQNNISGAQSDINVIRNRAGLPNNVTMVDKETAMAAIENERRHELFCEWGHRWFDLKRWDSLILPATKTRSDDVLGASKTTWKSTSILFPLPQSARDNNPNLTQNEGY